MIDVMKVEKEPQYIAKRDLLKRPTTYWHTSGNQKTLIDVTKVEDAARVFCVLNAQT